MYVCSNVHARHGPRWHFLQDMQHRSCDCDTAAGHDCCPGHTDTLLLGLTQPSPSTHPPSPPTIARRIDKSPAMAYSSTSLPLEKDHLRQEIELLETKTKKIVIRHLPHRWPIYEKEIIIMCKCMEPIHPSIPPRRLLLPNPPTRPEADDRRSQVGFAISETATPAVGKRGGVKKLGRSCHAARPIASLDKIHCRNAASHNAPRRIMEGVGVRRHHRCLGTDRTWLTSSPSNTPCKGWPGSLHIPGRYDRRHGHRLTTQSRLSSGGPATVRGARCLR